MKQSLFVVVSCVLLGVTQAFAPVGVVCEKVFSCSHHQYYRASPLQAVIDIGSEAAFDKTLKDSGDALVIVDYSTTWCGPCKGVLLSTFSYESFLA